ncbi:hypothetical protein EV426DRAFT_711781 [Tirmania nivea]|nr:hypothetical protein EV426DRAFT_711781 [Tirmania nivea]
MAATTPCQIETKKNPPPEKGIQTTQQSAPPQPPPSGSPPTSHTQKPMRKNQPALQDTKDGGGTRWEGRMIDGSLATSATLTSSTKQVYAPNGRKKRASCYPEALCIGGGNPHNRAKRNPQNRNIYPDLREQPSRTFPCCLKAFELSFSPLSHQTYLEWALVHDSVESTPANQRRRGRAGGDEAAWVGRRMLRPDVITPAGIRQAIPDGTKPLTDRGPQRWWLHKVGRAEDPVCGLSEEGVVQNAADLLTCPGVADGKERRWERMWVDPE